LLRKHTTYASYTTKTATYPKIRTVFHPHTQASKLPADIPLLVFIHGLGGSSAQFVPLLTSLINAAPCLAIDLPGCGLSDFKPDDIKAYTIKAHAELVAAAIDRHRAVDQKIVLIGHSMGCSIASLLASSTSPLSGIFYDAGHIAGVIAIAPKSSPPSPKQLQLLDNYVRYLPAFVLDLWRFYDNIGGINSASVLRWVGKDADTETRKLQLWYNQQSKSAVFLRYIMAIVETDEGVGSMFPGKDIWSGMKVPLFLVAAEADHVNPPAEIEAISEWLTHQGSQSVNSDNNQAQPSAIPTATADLDLLEDQLIGHIEEEQQDQQGPQTSKQAGAVLENQHTTQHSFALKTSVFPAPASHALLYSTSTVRILSGLIQQFLSNHCDPRLSLGWQLQHLSVAGKWDVKNLVKWQNTPTISEPIGGVFRAMKTMREVDEEHAPKIFVKKYSSQVLQDGVQCVVDISHENPVYAPAGLEEGGVEYHKFPIVSKLPPTADEVDAFNGLVDRLRESPGMVAAREAGGKPTVGVHCHYGFNRYDPDTSSIGGDALFADFYDRTGFFICCYMVERLGYKLQDAVDEFAQKRLPGIKHSFFVDELFVRYGMKMQRRNTIVGLQ
jgi:pimeloyl-ACP methyl ester carboxylesterase/protein-tyrosine phosphatase